MDNPAVDILSSVATLLKRSRNAMPLTESRPMRRSRLTLVPSLTAAAVLLAGCSSASSDPEETAEPSASSSAEAETEASCDDTTASDDAVVPGVGITDEFGTYCTVVFDPSSAAAFDPTLADETYLTSHGFTIRNAEAAYTTAVEYVVTMGLDSTRLDNYSLSEEEWFDGYRELFFDNGSQYTLADGLVGGGVTFTNYSPEPIVRDGNPRLSSLYLEQSGITTFESDGQTILSVNIVVDATYRGRDEGIVEAYLARNPDSTLEVLQEQSPQLFDGQDTGYSLEGSYTVNFYPDEFTLIGGTRYLFDLKVDGRELP